MNRRRPNSDGGFTLIEIMVVVSLVALLMSGATIGLRALAKTELRGVATKIAGAMRFAFDRALTNGRFYRLAFDFEQKAIVLEMSETRVAMLRDERDRKAENGVPNLARLNIDAFAEAPPDEPFQMFSGAGYRPVKLGGVVEVRLVWTPRYADPVREGKAFLYYFAQGLGEEAVVQIADGDAVVSLLQHSLTGKVRILPYAYEIERDQGERDDLGERVEP